MGRRFDVGFCADCGARQRVWHREWARASAPRCNACGGRLDPSKAAAKEHVAVTDTARMLGGSRVRNGRVVS